MPLGAAVVRVDADRHRRALAERRAGVDAVARDEQRRLGAEVRGRKAERAAAGLARDDRALDLDRAARAARAAPRTSPAATSWRIRVDETPSTCGATRVAIPSRSSSARSPLRRAAEAEARARDDDLGADRGEVRLGELLRRERRDLGRELDDERLLDAELGEQLEPALERREQRRPGSRAPRADAGGT